MNTDVVRIRFITKCEKYALPPGDFEVSSALNRKGLSDALNQVFDLETPVPFDFKIGPHFLRQTLGAALRLHQISSEDVVNIEFFPAFRPPTPDNDKNVDAWISCVRFVGNSSNIIYSLYDGTVRLNDQIYAPFGTPSPVKCVSLLGDNEAVSGDIDGCVSKFDLSNPTASEKYPLSNEPIHAIATYPTLHNLFIIGCADGNVSVWSTGAKNDGTLLSAMHSDSVQSLQWVDEKTLYSASLDRTIRIWDVDQLTEKSILSSTCGILSLAVRGNLILTSHSDRSIRLWDTRAEEHRSVIAEFKSHSNWVSDVKWVNDEVFVSGGYDGAVKLWNIGTQIPLYTMAQHDEKIFTVDANEKEIVAAGDGQVIHHFSLDQSD
ncbi:ribosome biogenesis protein ytm1 [Tritrichomonas musculus]|uniref:Ribosome biogenesis protein ytm1 n=1 Tax=Tritrichomonas musculus TaxID=1915356 RepID=A0ABR2KA11_9EUKA